MTCQTKTLLEVLLRRLKTESHFREKQCKYTRNSFHGGCHCGFGIVGTFLTSEFLVVPPSMIDYKVQILLSCWHLLGRKDTSESDKTHQSTRSLCSSYMSMDVSDAGCSADRFLPKIGKGRS